ncbi:MAG: sensor histidine kinase [Propionibacteriales bacterium]|nr:sensor histidine kinase [Propionibacteriales bacterium]
MTTRIDRVWQWLLDARLPAPLLLFALAGTSRAAAGESSWLRRPDQLAYTLVALAVLALVLRRQAPVAMLVLNGAAVATYLVMGYPFGPILFTVPFVALSVAMRWPLRRAVVAVGILFVSIFSALAVNAVRQEETADWTVGLLFALAWLAILSAPVAIGAALRVRREAAAGVRAEQARRAVSEEQLRMAQELHDVVGHGLAVIAMQAGVALHVLERDPAKAREALEAIRSTSKESLDGLRAELAVLRTPGDAARQPTPGLDEVEVLVDRIRAGGVHVGLQIDPDLSDVPSEVGAVAYRILQESLTNVLRHADTRSADIRVRGEGANLLLDVTDSGRGGTLNGDGSGIRGMRARAESVGGSLDAGPQPTGGFAVRARLPLVPGSGV